MKVESIAKGHRQKMAVESLLNHGIVTFREFCKAKSYYTSYTMSWHRLYKRLKNAGYPVTMIPGKRGGDWTSIMILDKKEQQQ